MTAIDRVPAEIRTEWISAVADVISGGIVIGGDYVSRFEEAFAQFCSAKRCVSVGNGLDALSLSLEALEVGNGDQVAVPAHTFIATWLAILRVGATPVAIDVTDEGQIDVQDLFRAGSDCTAVVPVHMHGGTSDMPAIMEWAIPRGIRVVEDCAQAHGAQIGGRSVGTWGDAGAFSFYPTKNLGALGDGGAVTTESKFLADRLKSMTNYGRDGGDKNVHVNLGTNSRLDSIQAGILAVNMQNLETWNSRRKEIAGQYLEALLQGSSSIRPLIKSVDRSVWHHFVVTAKDRQRLRTQALLQGIETDVHYPNLASEEIRLITGLPCRETPNADFLASAVTSFPVHPWLSDSEVDVVCNFLRSYRD